MKVSVWDTYVKKKNGSVMHFDILVPEEVTDEKIILELGRKYLETKNEDGQHLTSKECRFCHQEVATEEMENVISENGYYIIEMEGC
ncbi:MAG: DUF2024 family protein [Flavitalea sp.]